MQFSRFARLRQDLRTGQQAIRQHVSRHHEDGNEQCPHTGIAAELITPAQQAAAVFAKTGCRATATITPQAMINTNGSMILKHHRTSTNNTPSRMANSITRRCVSKNALFRLRRIQMQP